MHRHYILPQPHLAPNIIPRGVSSSRLSATYCALLSTLVAPHGSVAILRGSCTTVLRIRMTPSMTPSMTWLVVGGRGGVCSRLGFLLDQGGLLGRQHKGGAAGDGGIDEVQQGVGLIAPLEGQMSRHMCTEGQQPASRGWGGGGGGGRGVGGGGGGGGGGLVAQPSPQEL